MSKIKGHNISKVSSIFICFVHPIFSSFGFWYFGHISWLVIFFLFFLSCPSCLAKCKQRLCNIFVTSLPKVTKNKKWDKRNTKRMFLKLPQSLCLFFSKDKNLFTKDHSIGRATLSRLTWLIHASFLPSKWNLYLKWQFLV